MGYDYEVAGSMDDCKNAIIHIGVSMIYVSFGLQLMNMFDNAIQESESKVKKYLRITTFCIGAFTIFDTILRLPKYRRV